MQSTSKAYYERYWKNELPQDIKFFGGKPKPGDAEQNAEVVKKFCKYGDYILDYGCGEGYLVNALGNTFNPYGVDISEEAIRLAKKRFPQYYFRNFGEESNQKFDCICSFDVWEHVFDFDETFDYYDKWLKPGGKIIITTNEMCPIKMFIIAIFFMDTFFHPYSPHIRFFTKKSLRKLLESKGYKVIYTERRGNYCGVLSTGQTVVAVKEKNAN